MLAKKDTKFATIRAAAWDTVVGVRDHQIVKSTLATRCSARADTRGDRKNPLFCSDPPGCPPERSTPSLRKSEPISHHLHVDPKFITKFVFGSAALMLIFQRAQPRWDGPSVSSSHSYLINIYCSNCLAPLGFELPSKSSPYKGSIRIFLAAMLAWAINFLCDSQARSIQPYLTVVLI